MPSIRRLPHYVPLVRVAFVATSLVLLVCAGCAASGTSEGQRASTTTPISLPTVTAAPTATLIATPHPSVPNCWDLPPGPGSLATFPLPPGTISSGPNGAAGAGFWNECTPGSTEQSIVAFLNAALPKAGWQQWNPQTRDANGCGTEANDYWKWYKGDAAVGYTFIPNYLPKWMLAFCSLNFGH